MRLAFVSRHNPTREGSQDGKIFRALVEGLLADGHEVTAMSWAHDQPHDDMPSWCTYLPVPPEPGWRMHGRALLTPRWDAARIDWRPPTDTFAIAEDPLSWPVVAQHPGAAVVFHYLTKIDAPALRRPTPPDVQDMRHERRVARGAPVVMAMSDRVANGLGAPATVVPMAYPMPAEPLDLVDEPVVALLASWNWAPNHAALERLLASWPAVRDAIPGARLLLAGRGLDRTRVGTIGGVEAVGAVGVPAEVLGRAAVLAYPCPGTSGPKVKVIEAMAHGVPVVTTPSGVEGLRVAAEDLPVVADDARFADALIALLRDPARRAVLAARGRPAVVATHAPVAAARARIAAIERTARAERAAVIICTRDRPEMLADALDATIPTLRAGDELLVVDSASSTDGTRDVAARRSARIVRAARPGLSRARNLGVAETTAPVVVFTDDDCRPQPGWLDSLAAGFDASEVGFVLGQVRADVDDAHLPFDAARPRPPARFNGPADPIELGNGACMAFRRSAWDACCGADERLGAGTRLCSAEDHDLFVRLLQHGWTGVYEPDALVLHRDWRSHREVIRYNWGVGLGTGAMVAKLWRIADAETVRPLLRRRLVTDGVRELTRNIVQRDKSAIVAHTLKLTGTLTGLAVGLVLPRNGDRFR